MCLQIKRLLVFSWILWKASQKPFLLLLRTQKSRHFLLFTHQKSLTMTGHFFEWYIRRHWHWKSPGVVGSLHNLHQFLAIINTCMMYSCPQFSEFTGVEYKYWPQLNSGILWKRAEVIFDISNTKYQGRVTDQNLVQWQNLSIQCLWIRHTTSSNSYLPVYIYIYIFCFPDINHWSTNSPLSTSFSFT